MTGGPGKEQGTNKPPPTRRVRERSKGDTTCPTTSQNPPLWHQSWLNKACTTRKDSESEWLAKDNPETNPITIKPETVSHSDRAVLLGSLTLLLATEVPFPNKISCFVSTCVSSDNSFLSVGQEPSFGPWKRSPFLQQYHHVKKVKLIQTSAENSSSLDCYWAVSSPGTDRYYRNTSHPVPHISQASLASLWDHCFTWLTWLL